MAEGNPIPRITLDTEFVEPKPVINAWAGKIEIDQYKPKPAAMGGGWQWELGVRPLNGFVKGKTGLLYDWTDVKLEDGKPKKGTKLELVIESFREVFGSNDRQIGQGAFVGSYAMFARYEKNWGVNPKTKSEMKGNVLIAVRPMNDDEMRQYGLLGENDRSDFEWTDELAKEAAEALDGATTSSLKIAIINSGIEDAALTQRLLDGDGVQYLLENGFLDFDGKTYRQDVSLRSTEENDEEEEDTSEADVGPPHLAPPSEDDDDDEEYVAPEPAPEPKEGKSTKRGKSKGK